MKKNWRTKLVSLLGVFLLLILTIDTQAQTYTMRDTTVTHCSGKLYDTGGPGGDYSSNEDSAFTITVGGASTITLTFIAFDLRTSGTDEVRIYDGASTASPLLAGPFSGNTVPGNVTSTGSSITIRFQSDGSQEDPGFEIDWDANTTPNVTLNASANPICLGDPVTFTVTDSSGAGDPDFSWEINGAPAAGSSNLFTYTTSALSDLDEVRVIMTPQAGGCYLKATDTSAITMNVNPIATPSVAISTSDPSICAGNNVTFTVIDSTDGGSDPSFQWKRNGVNVGTDLFTYSNAALVDNDTIAVVMTSNVGSCLSKPNDTTFVVMNVNPNPTVSISTSKNIDCFGADNGSATANATGGSGTIAYSWNSAPVQNTATATALPPGTYQVTTTDDSLCFDTISVTITEPTDINLSFSVTDASSFGAADGAIDATITGGSVAVDYSYSWNTTPVQTTQDIGGLVSRYYVLTVTDDSSCTKIDSAFVDQPALLTGGSIQYKGSATGKVCNGDTVGQFNQQSAITGGVGPYTYTWQFSTDLLNWNNFPSSDSSNSYTHNGTIPQDIFVRRRVVDANDSAFSNILFLDYIPDIPLAITGLSNTYCHNNANVSMGAIPAGGTFVQDSSYISGTTFIPRNTQGGGISYPVVYEYVDGNSCYSVDTVMVLINDTNALDFNLNTAYPTTAPLDTLTGNPAGGSFSGIGVYQQGSGEYVFDPSIPTPGAFVDVTYTYTAANSCVSKRIKTTTIQNTNVTMTGFQPDNIYCRYDAADTIRVDLGASPPTVVRDSFFIKVGTGKAATFKPVAEIGNTHPGSFLFDPAALIPVGNRGDFQLAVLYRYGVERLRLVSLFPVVFATDTIYTNVYDTVNIVHVGNVRILPTQKNSDNSLGPPFQYCENLTSVALLGDHFSLGTNSVTHAFSVLPATSALSHSGNSDTVYFNPSDPSASALQSITYTYTDVESSCFATISENFRIDTLPAVSLTGIDTVGGYCSNTGTVVFNGAPYATNQGTFLSGTISISHINGNNFASFTTSPATIGNHTINYEYTNPTTGCFQAVQANFAIDTIPNLSIFLDATATCINNDSVRIQGRLGNSFNTGLGTISGTGVVDNSNSSATHFDATIAGINTSPGHLITYSYTDLNNCSNTVDTNMVVNPLPDPSFTTSKSHVCAVPDSVLFNPTFPLGFGETDSYFLNGSPVALSPENYKPLDIRSHGPNSTDTILRVLTNGTTGCFDSATAVITVNPNVTPSITVDPQTFYCANQGSVGFTLNPPSEGNPGGNRSPQGDYFIENTLIVDLGGGSSTTTPLAAGFTNSTFNTNNVTGNQVIITYLHTDSITGCRATVRDTTTITSLPVLVVDDSTDVSPNNGFYCYGLTGTVYGGVNQNPQPITLDSINGFGMTILPTPPDSTFSFSTTQPSVDYNTTKTFKVTYYYHNSTNFCANFTEFDVNISRPDSIDFAFVDAGLDSANHDTTICELDVDRVNLLLEPSSLPTGSTRRYKLNSETNLLGSNFFIPRQDTTVVGSNWVKYIITDKNGCEDSITHTIDIYANPQIGWIDPSLCAADTITFTDSSKISSGTIARRDWDLGEGPSSQISTTTNQINYKFLTKGSKVIELTAVSNWGCMADTIVPIEVDEPPNANFTWFRSDECGDNIRLVNTTKNSAGNQNGIQFIWDFGDGTDTTHTVNPTHTYTAPEPDNYIISLIAGFSDCADTINQVFTQRPAISSFPYFENFESGKNGWELEYDYDNDLQANGRWNLGTPAKTNISGAFSGDSCWVTGTTGNYRSNDTTYVTSPCFDFSNLERPMMRLWVNYIMDENDGVVIQYTTDTGTTVRWNKLGDSPQNGFNSGIKWYTKDGIASSPGKQKPSERNVGWTGTTNGKWVEARHDLDVLAGEPYVRLRFAIGSGENTEDEGFAFDDIWIGERRKNVLLETFVNTSSIISKSANDKMNPIVANNNKDVLSVQYHVSFPGPQPDPLNQDNQADPSARVLYYGISESPFAVVDGNLYNGVPLVFNQEILQLQALRDPEFQIQLQTARNGNNLDITAEMSADNTVLNRLLPHTPTDVTLHIVVVEDSITIAQLPANSVKNGETLFLNTLKQMFPTAAGTNYTHGWTNGESEKVTLSAPLVNYKGGDSDWKVIAFVQDNQTRAIYQAVYNNANNPTTGIETLPDGQAALNGFLVYPNPAAGMVNIAFGESLDQPHQLHLINQLGAVVKVEQLSMGIKQYSINTATLAEGVYYLVLTDAKGNRSTEKLIIMR